ncbi:MAG TPA: ABC transporter ATP-binding protein [Paenibacillus sp.]
MIIKIIKIYKKVSISGLLWVFIISISIPFIQNLMLVYTEKIGNSLSRETAGTVISLLIIQSAIYFLLQLLMLANKMIENKLNPKYDFYLNSSIKRKLSKIKMYLLDDSEIHNKIITVQQIIPQIGVSLLKSILTLFQALIAILGMVYILRNLNFFILILLVLFSLVNIFISHIFNKFQLQIYNSSSEHTRKREYFSRIFSNRELMAENRIFQLHNFFIEKWRELFWVVETPNINLNNKRSILVYTIQILINFVQLAMLILFINTSDSIISIGSFMLLTQAILQLQGQANEFVASVSHIHQTITFLPKYFEVLNLPEEQEDQGINFSGLKQEININCLSFKYKNSIEPSLNNVSFTVKRGESVAIVGHNGSGKTTLVKCMLGLYDEFVEGSIYYDGVSATEYNKESFRKKVAVLFQNYGKYPLTFKQNIALGDLNRTGDEFLYSKSMNLSNAWSVVDSLPKGSNTVLSPEFDGGVDMSGGQWQKTALARMYFRDADIIFLDEPTSAIDPISENEIYKQFFEISKEKTSIILTHRLGMCKWVDKVIVMEDGRVKEIGTHEELLKSGLLYKKMYLAQSEWYTTEKILVKPI